LLRSVVVRRWPSLEVRVFVDSEGGTRLSTLRQERLSDGVLIAMFAGVPGRVELQEPNEGTHFGFELEPGGDLSLPAGEHELEFEGFMQSIVPVDHLEIVVNGEVVQRIKMDANRRSSTFSGRLKLGASSWVLLRAWNDGPSADIFDRFPYATTNPVFVEIDGLPLRSKADADYFIDWIDRVYAQLSGNKHYNDEREKQAVLTSIESARAVFENRR